VSVRVGVLALQGGFARHAQALERSGAHAVEVRRVAELDRVDALVLPGGETTTLLNLMRDEPWFEALTSFHASGRALFGTCAGAILLAREVRNPAQPGLAVLDVAIERNAWGRQVDSFEAVLDVVGLDAPLAAVFIRAPRFREIGPAVEVLATYRDEPVLVRQGTVLAATFHPELAGDDRLHRLFVRTASARRPASDPATAVAAS